MENNNIPLFYEQYQWDTSDRKEDSHILILRVDQKKIISMCLYSLYKLKKIRCERMFWRLRALILGIRGFLIYSVLHVPIKQSQINVYRHIDLTLFITLVQPTAITLYSVHKIESSVHPQELASVHRI